MRILSIGCLSACAFTCTNIGAQDPTALLRAEQVPANAVWVESLDLDRMFQRRGRPRAGASFRGQPITLGGQVYPHGIGTQSISDLLIDLKGRAVRFRAMAGLEDSARGEASVQFEVWRDDTQVFDSGVMRPGDAPKLIDVDITSARILQLRLDDGGDTSNGDVASWGGAMIVMRPGASEQPESYTLPPEPGLPIAMGTPPEPAIHGARITGATPGRPYLFRIPATGEGPLRFAAQNLPAGLSLDANTGIISGSLAREGRTDATLTVQGARGSASRVLTIVGAPDALALTPPMGWNSWNAWGRSVDDAKVRAAADWMVRTGLAAHGFQYINIDDGWEGQRDTEGVLQPNEKFPDMKALADYVHAKGLKLGIYSSPGPSTCQGLPGSYQHEDIDARTWAEWGIDYLKHDWCSYDRIAADRSIAELQKPYLVMRDALAKVDRDIVYSLGNYGYGNVWEWGDRVGGHLWRTTGDLYDTWPNLESVGFRQAGREKWAGPGHWNDTDMLVVGPVGWGPQLHPSRLTQDEQILHITLWAMQAAPLLSGADLSQLDNWTIALLTNDEVINVDQDPLGRAGGVVWNEGRLEVWARPLDDGTWAVALFNRGLTAYDVTARWSDIGLSGAQPVRDLWQRKDLGTSTDRFTASVPRHGAVFVRVGRSRR